MSNRIDGQRMQQVLLEVVGEYSRQGPGVFQTSPATFYVPRAAGRSLAASPPLGPP